MNLTSINQSLGQGLTPLSLRVALVLCLASSLLSAATIDDLQFTLINGDTEYAVSAVDPTSIAGAVDIPATYNGKAVTEIGRLGFGVSDDATVLPELLTSVNIPASIKVIEYEAFNKCPSLKTVTFAPDSQLTTVGDYTFANCTTLQAIILPDSLTYLSQGMLQNCTELASVELPQALLSIEAAASPSPYTIPMKQAMTLGVVSTLSMLSPNRSLNPWFIMRKLATIQTVAY